MTKKNYYICLRFQGRPELHMTLGYFKALAPTQIAEVMGEIDTVMGEKKKTFPAKFSLEAWYGPHHTVRVLEPRYNMEWPDWLLRLIIVKSEWRDNTYKWHPHVASENDDELNLTAIAVSVMCKKIEVARWDLS